MVATKDNSLRAKKIAGPGTFYRECRRDLEGHCSGFAEGRQGEADDDACCSAGRGGPWERLYQYFPNKSALLRAALKLHVEEILVEVDKVCVAQRGQPVEQMAEALAVAFLAVKMLDPKKSRALYAVSSDVEGAKVAAGGEARANDAIVGLLQERSPRR